MNAILAFFKETRDFGNDKTALKQAIFTWFFKDGFIFDILIAVVILIIDSVVPLVKVHPLTRYQIPNDPDISYPIVEETFSGQDLVILMLVIPIGTFIVGSLLSRSLADFHHAMLTLLEGFALVIGWKRWMNLVGRYRPNYLASVAAGTSDANGGNESYPSGHAAYMFCGMTITTLYLIGKFKIFARPFHGTFFITFLCLTPMMLATVVAVSRPANHKHHFSDINAGMFVGLSLSMLCYFLNYPSLFDQSAGEPKLRSFQRRRGVVMKSELNDIHVTDDDLPQTDDAQQRPGPAYLRNNSGSTELRDSQMLMEERRPLEVLPSFTVSP